MVKIRDSCHSCAVSKVRCPKERPVCSRCGKKGIACAYFVTKRPGRKREKPLDAPNSVETCDDGSGESSDLPRTQAGSTSAQTETLPVTQLSPRSSPASAVPCSAEYSSEFPNEIASFMEGFAGVTFPLELLDLPELSAINNHFTDLLTPRIDIEAGSLDVETSANTQDHHDIANLLLSDEMDLDSDSLKQSLGCTMSYGSCSPTSNVQAQSSNSDNSETRSTSSTVCRCMALAMGILHHLFSPEPLSNSSGNTVPISDTEVAGSASSTRALLERNKVTIEAIKTMLQCTCAETGYLTIMLSMIVFKMLESYAMAARQVHDGAHREEADNTRGGTLSAPMATWSIVQFCIDSSSSDDESTSRESTQLILGELHHVQNILNQLALRLDAQGSRDVPERALESNHDRLTSTPLLNNSFSHAETFSSSTLEQIEADLRRGLTTLSSEIITRLRRI